MPNELYRDYIDGKADEIVNALGGTITPEPANAELYRDFLDRKFDDVINAIHNYIPVFKTVEYTGTGSETRTITFPETPKYVLITKKNNSNTCTNLIFYNISTAVGVMVMTGNAGAGVNYRYALITYNGNEMTLNGGAYSLVAMNDTNVEYTVYYI